MLRQGAALNPLGTKGRANTALTMQMFPGAINERLSKYIPPPVVQTTHENIKPKTSTWATSIYNSLPSIPSLGPGRRTSNEENSDIFHTSLPIGSYMPPIPKSLQSFDGFYHSTATIANDLLHGAQALDKVYYKPLAHGIVEGVRSGANYIRPGFLPERKDGLGIIKNNKKIYPRKYKPLNGIRGRRR